MMPIPTSTRSVAVLALLCALLVLVPATLADLAGEEAALNPSGSHFEVNVGGDGDLWISDYGAGEVWRVNAATNAYTVFEGMVAPSDARPDGEGTLWWGEGTENTLGEMDLNTRAARWWALPGANAVLGTAVDGAGRVWASSLDTAHLYRFDPATSQLCTYPMPADGIADALAYDAHSEALWVASGDSERIYRITAGGATWTMWQLPVDSGPVGLDMGPEGRVWMADPNRYPNRGILASLDGQSSLYTEYDIPTGSLPQMVTAAAGGIFYTEQLVRSVGRLDPGAATGIETALSAQPVNVSPECSTASPSRTATLSQRAGTLVWNNQTYPELFQGDGWEIYGLPVGAFPWGIAGEGASLWFVDNGRQVLGRASFSSVTACAVADEDGDEATTNDRTPLSGWSVYLTVDGARQEPARITDETGCASWELLSPGETYGVEQVVEPGWLPLGDSSHSFGPAAAGAVYSHTFLNQPTDTGSELFLPLLRS